MNTDIADFSNKSIIMVIATVSSGKSTLINSLMGGDILPAKNEACTAKAFYISNGNSAENAGRIIVHKKDESYEENNIERFESLSVFNDNTEVDKIFFEHSFEGIKSSDIVLVDTPGVNNSQSEEHGMATYELIEGAEKGILLYVINATQIGIDDDRRLMGKIIDVLNGNKQSLDVIFAVNKVDEFDLEKENLTLILDNVKKYILSCVKEGSEFYSQEELAKKIIPISALTAKIIRKSLKGKPLTRLEKKVMKNLDVYDELRQYHFEKYACIPEEVEREINRRLYETAGDDEESFYRRVLIHTGIPVVEEIINKYFNR